MPLQQDDEESHDGVHGSLDGWRQPEAVEERERRQAEAKSKKRETRFGRVGFATLRAQKAQPPDFVIDDWMVAREVSFFAGESEAGKTFLAIDIAFRVALGWPVFGRKVKRGLVIYQIGESGDSLTKLRIPAWLAHFGEDLSDDVPLEVLKSRVNLATADNRAEDGAHRMLDAIKNISAEHGMPVSLVIVDTFSKAFVGGNENDGKDVSRAIANAEMIAKETGAHVAIVHHFPKGGATLRGHGSLRADVDSVAMVRTDPQTKIRTIKLDKLKDGEKAEMQFELKQVRLGEREGDGKPITSCVVLPVGEKAERRTDVANSVRLSTTELGLFQAMWRAIEQFGGAPHPSLGCPSHVRVVPYDEVRRLYVDASPMQDAETFETEEAREDARRRHVDRLRKQMQRACQDLVRKWKVIALGQAPDPNTGKVVHYAWWTGRPVRGMPETYPPKPKQSVDNVDAVLAEGGDWLSEIM